MPGFKRLILCLLGILISVAGFSQKNELTQKGNKVYVEGVSKNENSMEAVKALRQELNEWGYWQVVNEKSNSNFTLKVDVKTSEGITLTSWGGTSYTMVGQIVDKNDSVTWESSQYKSSPNGTNGFNSGRAVVNKFVKALKKKYK